MRSAPTSALPAQKRSHARRAKRCPRMMYVPCSTMTSIAQCSRALASAAASRCARGTTVRRMSAAAASFQARLNRHSTMTLASALHLCRCATTHAVAAREVTWHHRRITAVFRARALLRWFCATMAAASLCATTARQSSRALCRARRLWALYAASAAELRGPALRTRSRHVCTARAASAAAACRLAIAACTRAARWRRQQSSAALA